MEVVVHRQILKLLKSSQSTASGSNGGFLLECGTNNIVSCIRCQSLDPNKLHKQTEDVKQYLPGGVNICGLFYTEKSKPVQEKIVTELKNLRLDQLFSDRDDVVVCVYEENIDSITEDNFYMCDSGYTVVNADVTVTDEDVLSNKQLLRTRCSLPLSLEITENTESWKTSTASEIEAITSQVESVCSSYHLRGSNVLLSKNKTCGIAENLDCCSLYDYIDDDDGFTKKKTRKSKTSKMEYLDFSLYFQISGDSAFENIPTCSPIIHQKQGNFKGVSMTISIDVLSIVSPDTAVGQLADIMSTAVCNQLSAIRSCVLRHCNSKTFYTPEAFHFQPHNAQIIYTIMYPKNITDDQLGDRRKELHRLLCLPLDKPFLKRNNTIMFPADLQRYGYLVNPHVGVSSSGVKDGKVYLVDGLYSYHHYMQDRFDDNKWGCAYRSLQTLVSWFRLQGYTDKPIPSHTAIQQALVDVGDKEPKFIGSRQWIGSMEVSYCLDHLIGITSKIMFVNNGAEMASKGRELAMHFQTQGTPVMIGGGVLAHTILGVDFNDVTGDLKFLILDPHYTGSEDLKVIQDKGWCGWKGLDFWDKTAHYNLCLPQRPKAI